MQQDALVELLELLKERGYRFHTVTPATHARVLARPFDGTPALRDVFGWNRPFRQEQVDADILQAMRRADILREEDGVLKSALRVASLGEDLFLHSAFPTEEEDAVFFGPDTYRFARFIAQRWPGAVRHIVDLGAGGGPGGIAAARLAPQAQVSLVDVNPRAMALARVNARVAGVAANLLQGEEVPGGADLVIANPPYMIDSAARTYRDGGDLHGGAVALEWTERSLARLPPGGTLLLYTGAAIVAGTSPLEAALQRTAEAAGASLQVEEIDPDVFGEELEQPAYADVERIAVIGAVIRKP